MMSANAQSGWAGSPVQGKEWKDRQAFVEFQYKQMLAANESEKAQGEYEKMRRKGMIPDVRPETAEDKIKSALDASGRSVNEHPVTNIGAINLYNNIYDAEDPARVIQHLTAKAIRDNASRPAQSASVPSYHY
jgi:hypothetical protein